LEQKRKEPQDREAPAPQAPEGYPESVRRQLNQYGQTHEGQKEPVEHAHPGTADHMGATETAVTPTKVPMAGPSDLVGEQDKRPSDDDIDPAEELTPG
jgi:hypothetical protein